MTPAMSSETHTDSNLNEVHDHLYRILTKAMARRPELSFVREGHEGPELAWMLHEREVMRAAVNEIRAQHGLPAVHPIDIIHAEYKSAAKEGRDILFARNCADIATGKV